MNTRDLASKLGKKPHTLHAAFCRKGSYFGLVPAKLPDGSLLWPDDSVEQLLRTAEEQGPLNRTKRALEVLSEKRVTTEAAKAGGAA